MKPDRARLTSKSRITFGTHNGTCLNALPYNYLIWMSQTLLNTDFHEWAIAAKETLAELERSTSEERQLQMDADDFLRSHGLDPRKL